MITTSAFQVAQRLVGTTEIAGALSNPLVLAMLQTDASWVENDETPWCSALPNFVNKLLGLPRSHSLAARSWLLVGTSIPLTDARAENDIVVLSRGKNPPGASVLQAPGHVGYYAGQDADTVSILGGNQGNSVNISAFPKSRILGIRRLI